MAFKDQVISVYKTIQDEICTGLEICDGLGKFEEENWEREGGGGGRTRIMQNGNLIEKGGVNFSAVHGSLPTAVKNAFKVENDEFFATGVSIVVHPNHPLIPIIHMNIRYFEMPSNDGSTAVRWFGGGIDLTPHYINKGEAHFFHQTLKDTCDTFHSDFYPKFKQHADDYFFIKHRNETRGIGGIFYDRLQPANTGLEWESILDFSAAVGRTFLPVYTKLIDDNRGKAFTSEQQEWQYLRRSRYAEFNLVYDAGTKFGLETNGRIESILMSLPPLAKWKYDFNPEVGTEEAYTQSMLKKSVTWTDEKV